MKKPWLMILLAFAFLVKAPAQSFIIAPIKIDSKAHIKQLKSERQRESDPVVMLQLSKQFMFSDVPLRYMGDGWVAIPLSLLEKHFGQFAGKITHAGWLLPDSKVSLQWLSNPDFKGGWSSDQQVKMQVFYYGNTLEHVQQLLADQGMQILDHHASLQMLTVLSRKSQIYPLLHLTTFMYVAPISDERTPLAPLAITMNKVNKVQQALPEGLGLKGNGIGIGVWDFGAAGNHIDFEETVENIENDFFNTTGSQHTSLVSGAIAGRGVLRQDVLGVAPASKVYVHNFFGDIIDEMRSLYASKSVRVTNHSYNVGSTFQCGVTYSYDAVSAALDDYTLEKPDMVNVYAAGNSAVSCAYDFSTIVPGFQYAKNVITVGNLQNNETLYPGSARGPTTDGRLRPEVMAKGASTFTPSATGIVLTGLNQNYTGGFGTSFSAPQVAGIVGLLQEAAINASQPFPQSSLVKAILCNTANDLGNAGPDYSYGFGRVDAFKAISSYQNNQFIENNIADGQQKTFNINVPSGTAQLKVTLCWNDPPAMLPAVKILTNDLDLKVVKGIDTVAPWVLNPLTPAANAIHGRDSLNNIEQVTIDNPVAGIHTLVINGLDVPDGPQNFSIAYYFEEEGADITFPDGGEVLAANVVTYIRWEAMETDSLLDVEYSLNGGSSWSLIGTVPASSGSLLWTTPNSFSDSALVRLKNGATIWAESDSLFAIMARPTTASLLQCNYGIRVGWSTVTGATAYVVSKYDNAVWSDLDTLSVSPYYLRNAQMGKEYILAVRPVTPKVDGPRSIAVRLTPRPANCGFPDTDLGLVNVRPFSGRLLTSSALSSSQPLKFRIQNYRTLLANFSVKLSWQVNGGTIYDSTFTVNIASNSFTWMTTNTVFNFSAAGNYTVKAWLTAAPDTHQENDTIVYTIRQLSNAAVNLPLIETVEVAPFTVADSLIGLPNVDRFDFFPVANARVSSFGGQIFAPKGRRAFTLDNYSDNSVSATSNLVWTVNLSNYTDSLVYLENLFRSRGEASGNDSIYVRGSDVNPWINIYDIYTNALPNAAVRSTDRLNVSKALSDNGQTFSTSSQIRIKVDALRAAASITTNGGYTFDDFQLTSPGKDVELLDLVYDNTLCVSNGADSVRIYAKAIIRNNYIDSAKNVDLYLTNADTLVAITSVDFAAFEQKEVDFSVNLLLDSNRKVFFDVWIEANQDRLQENDSLLKLSVKAVEMISSLPYLNDFETNGFDPLTVDGQNGTWERGFPSKDLIAGPAEGSNSWVTSLTGNYLNNEVSALYLFCFIPSMLDSNGQIAFEHIFDTETDYDWVTLEYSQNGGVSWQALGKKNNGYNWFNESVTPPGWIGQRNIWQVASYPLSQDSFATGDTVILRLLLTADDVETREGFSLDDLRLIRVTNALVKTDSLTYNAFSNGSGNVYFGADSASAVAILHDGGQSLDSVSLSVKSPAGCNLILNNYQLLSRKYFFTASNSLSQPKELTVFIPNETYLDLVAADTNVRSMKDIGVLLYNGVNTDDTIYNNGVAGYTELPADSVRFLPYSNGYEVRFKIPFQTCEIYFSSLQAMPYTIPYQLNFLTTIADVEIDSILDTIQIALECAGGEVFEACSNGHVSLVFSGCGISGTLNRPVINGIATFDDLSFLRGPQNNVTLSATYIGNCTDTLVVLSNNFNVTSLISSPDSLPEIITDTQKVCFGGSVALEVLYQNVSLPASYLWSPGATLNDSTLSLPIASPSISTNYSLVVTDNDGCTDTASLSLVVVPYPEINIQPKDLSACRTSFSLLSNALVPTYQWQKRSGSVWNDITDVDTNFNGAKNDTLVIVNNIADYDSTWFRCLVTEDSLCTIPTDSVNYFKQPIIVLSAPGVFTANVPCDVGGWSYYDDNNNPGKYAFAINWAPDSTLSIDNANAKLGAEINIQLDSDYTQKDSIISGTPYATFTMKRYWNVDIGTDSLSEPVQVKFYYAAAERNDILDATIDYISLHPGAVNEGFEWFKTISGAFDPSNDVQPVNVMNAIALNNLNDTGLLENGILYAMLDSIISFSGGTGAAGVGPLTTPLPIELVSYTATCKGNIVELNWQTASEFNTDYFRVEKSNDGFQYNSAAIIPAAGYSVTPIDYTWTDSNTTNQLTYYRLSERDLNGNIYLLKTVTAACTESGTSFTVFYDPSKGIVVQYVAVNEEKVQLNCFDMEGKALASQSELAVKGYNEWVFSDVQWPMGIYVVQLYSGTERFSEKLLKY